MALAVATSAPFVATLIGNDSRSGVPASPAVVRGTPSPEPTSRAPAAAVRRMHGALHDLGTQCGPSARADLAAVDRDVSTILDFARRYPEGRFAVDDETGSVLSLLLVARDAVRTCSPSAARRVDGALPLNLRDAAADS